MMLTNSGMMLFWGYIKTVEWITSKLNDCLNVKSLNIIDALSIFAK